MTDQLQPSAGAPPPAAETPTDESIFVTHARMQGAADGWQGGWHAALKRIGEGDKVEDLQTLVPLPPVCSTCRRLQEKLTLNELDHADRLSLIAALQQDLERLRAVPPPADETRQQIDGEEAFIEKMRQIFRRSCGGLPSLMWETATEEEWMVEDTNPRNLWGIRFERRAKALPSAPAKDTK